MNDLNYFSLDLRRKLAYHKTDISPFVFPDDAEEVLIIFDADNIEGKSIEPNLSKLLGQPKCIGMIKKDDAAENGNIELPLGTYFFSQVREVLDENGFAELAAEVQKEALWERRRLGKKIYLRYLYEHGSPVTQVFREMLEE